MAPASPYQVIPQADPDDTAKYTQPAPGYQAEVQASTGDGPRDEYDNVPDDFKYGGSAAEATPDIRMLFIRKVCIILMAQLGLTVAMSVPAMTVPAYRAWIQQHWPVLVASVVLLLVCLGLTIWKRKSYPTNLFLLTTFTACTGYITSVVVSFSKGPVVLEAVVTTLGIVAALTLFASQTKYDFTSWQFGASIALWIVVLSGIVLAFFPHDSKVELGYGIIGALVFSLYLVIDIQRITRHFQPEEEVAAAISLYLNIINLFLHNLRIINAFNS